MTRQSEEIARLEEVARFSGRLTEIMATLKVAADYILMAIKNADPVEANRSAQRCATDLRHAADLLEKAIACRQHEHE
jgi:hypothetical protein